jgi:hypothetical protein
MFKRLVLASTCLTAVLCSLLLNGCGWLGGNARIWTGILDEELFG